MAERKRRGVPAKTNSNSLLSIVKKGLKTKGFIYVTAGNLVNAVLGGLFYLIAARILSVSNYGYINYYLSLGFFMSSIPILGLRSTISTFYPKEGKDSLIKESTLLTFILGIIAGVATTLYVLFFPAQTGSNSTANLQTSIQLLASGNPFSVSVIPLILDSLQYSIQLLTGGNIAFVFMIPLVLGTVFYSITLARALGRREYKKFAILTSIVRVLEIVLVIAFYFIYAFTGYFYKDLDKLMLVAYIAPFFLVSYDYLKDLFDVDRTSFHFSEVRAKMTFTLHTWGMSLAQASRSSLDKIVVGLFFGLLFLGTYNLAFQFLLIFLIVPSSVLSYLLPEKSGGSARHEVEIISIFLAVAITVLGIFLAPYLIRWFFPSFTNSITVTQWLSLAVVPATIASIKTSKLLSEERPKVVLVGYVSALTVNISGILLLGQRFQAVGFALAFVISQVALMIILLVLPSSTFLSRIRRDLRYISIFVLIVGLLVFYPAVNYAFSPQFLWFVIFNPYNGLYYLFYINYNSLSPVVFWIKALIFTIVVSGAALISIVISQKLTESALKPGVKTENTEIIQQWKTCKKITSIALILQYLILISLAALASLIWYNALQQYISTLLSLARYTLIIVSALGILYLVHPMLDDEVILAQACLNIIDSLEGGSEKENVKKIELVRFMLYILLNHALSKGLESIEEFNLEQPLTILFLALLQKEKETQNKARAIITNLLRAITEQRVQNILKYLSEIDQKLGAVQELAKSMEIRIRYPSLTLYSFNPSKKLNRLKAVIPLSAQILLAILIFLGKWLYYTSFSI